MPREALPNRRYSENCVFWHDGQRFTATIGRYDDGRIGELFLSAGRSESAIEAWARDLAVVTSVAIQYGAPIRKIRDVLTVLSDGSPAGPLGVLMDMLEPENE